MKLVGRPFFFVISLGCLQSDPPHAAVTFCSKTLFSLFLKIKIGPSWADILNSKNSQWHLLSQRAFWKVLTFSQWRTKRQPWCGKKPQISMRSMSWRMTVILRLATDWFLCVFSILFSTNSKLAIWQKKCMIELTQSNKLDQMLWCSYIWTNS